MNGVELWRRYQHYLCAAPTIGLQLDISRMKFDEAYLEGMTEPMSRALAAMDELERGAKANIDEDRMVGHYWLRAPELAPTEAIRAGIEQTIAAVKRFADEVHTGAITPQRGDGFYVVLVIGIGGSALGPQFVCDALGQSDDPVIVRFLDNTDPDGIDRVLHELDDTLAQTLTVVISKSGTTLESRNAMLEVAAAYGRMGLDFAKHAVAVTCEGTPLHEKAVSDEWLGLFLMWDWVGGRTSVTSAVGLLPAALLGVDIDAFLAGARECDVVTRGKDMMANPAALLSLMWYYAGGGRGTRDMVVLPYRDRLGLLVRYLQQLVTESAGKEHDRNGQVVRQGLTVYGNRGSTDQHSYLQQLLDGPNEFFATFISVRRGHEDRSVAVEEDITAGDCLNAFLLATRDALYAKDRESVTISLDRLDAHRTGALVALFERAVGLYAELINVNAYHQPGVEAIKVAARAVIDLQRKILRHLEGERGATLTPEEVAAGLSDPEAVGTVHDILEHLSAGRDRRVIRMPGSRPSETRYGMIQHVPER